MQNKPTGMQIRIKLNNSIVARRVPTMSSDPPYNQPTEVFNAGDIYVVKQVQTQNPRETNFRIGAKISGIIAQAHRNEWVELSDKDFTVISID